MTSIFDDNGRQIPVTVIECGPCVVLQKKTIATDGYEAAVLGFIDQKEHRLNKASLGRFKKAEVAPKRILAEIAIESGNNSEAGSTA
ncbi:MAG: 50S ribosomal protein L3, partial [Lentisphaerae bacterium]|nr:50S ribosomal protein L3 [Lentisphaerota bacterium]